MRPMKLLDVAKKYAVRAWEGATAAVSPSKSSGGGSAMLPDPDPIKPPSTQSSIPAYRTQVTGTTSALTPKERNLANTDTLSLRSAATTKDVVRNFAIASPDLSATVHSYLRVGIPERYTVIARNMDGSVSPEGTQLAGEILRRVTYVPDYSIGFNSQASVYALACSLGKELMYYGAAALEVVLNDARLPVNFAPVGTSTLRFYESKSGFGLSPVQVVGGTEVDLNIPTFLYTSVDQDLKDAYSSSMLESAIQPVLADQQFMNDLRRLMARSIYPRITATIFEERVRKAAPANIQNDATKMATFMQGVYDSVSTALNGLAPEDALVGFDLVEYEYMNDKQGDVSGNLTAVQDLINSKVATGAKTMPAVFGRNQTGTASSTDALLFAKSANVLRLHISQLLSQALTVSTRLMGQDVYVEFTYAPIDLRPTGELEAYKAMEQSRYLMQLSLGMITDEEACLLLTGNLPPANYVPLAGTMFMSTKQADPSANPDSQTSNMNNKNATPTSPKSPTKA